MHRFSRQTLLRALGVVFLVVLVASFFAVYQIAQVSGHSMEPAFKDQDLVLINKRRLPTRYDAIAFEWEDQLLVKRIIGMPGDRYSKEGNNLVITVVRGDQEISYTVLLADDTAEQLPTAGLIQLGEYFVIGDAIYGSFDSRNLGFIAHSDVRGIVRQVF
ncbi:signal peptidase I [Enterococcus casseliflavus]|uniref:signal peptidase I n=1 Tax=Enterococcus casseliflavus TaxID=37734 RepID=UPI001432DA3E|nr:signal peptidase I [Enterococcus casseliflavus]NKD31645.1 signal peptidase I [Enterococcus casseliflavus]